MHTNHPFIIATASLFLATKVNDEPRSIRLVVSEMLKQWYGRPNPDVRVFLADDERFKALQQQVSDAEQVMMFTVGFDFNIDIIAVTLTQLVKVRPALSQLKGDRKFQQFFLNACNDIIKKDATMVLEYSTTDISLAICQFYIKVARLETFAKHGPSGESWCEAEGLSAAAWKDINNRLESKVYTTEKGSKGSKPAGESGGVTEVTDGLAAGTVLSVGMDNPQVSQQRSESKSEILGRQHAEAAVGIKRPRLGAPSDRLAAVSAKTPAWLDPGSGVGGAVGLFPRMRSQGTGQLDPMPVQSTLVVSAPAPDDSDLEEGELPPE